MCSPCFYRYVLRTLRTGGDWETNQIKTVVDNISPLPWTRALSWARDLKHLGELCPWNVKYGLAFLCCFYGMVVCFIGNTNILPDGVMCMDDYIYQQVSLEWLGYIPLIWDPTRYYVTYYLCHTNFSLRCKIFPAFLNLENFRLVVPRKQSILVWP